ncbi:HAD-IA family hydrolase [Chlamydiales bacterium]|nr:HAD-IA family hydrolase [Chlamydiales bacterium]
MSKIKGLFLDVGGVMMTNGWDHHGRAKVLEEFGVDRDEFEVLHKEWNNDYEKDLITLDEYLERTVFYKKRFFSMDAFKKAMFSLSKPYIDVINQVKKLKEEFRLQIHIVSNEAKEVMQNRIKLAGFDSFVGGYFFSCFVHLQKPDPRMYQLALDVTHLQPEDVIYIDDRKELIEAASLMGIKGILNESWEKTEKELRAIVYR